MKKIILSLFSVFSLFFVFSTVSWAYEYPIPQLGNCASQRECFLYCEIPKNHSNCWSFSVYGNQVLGDETPEQKVGALGITFPIEQLGNCANVTECKAFCDIAANKTTCATFAKEKGLTKKEKIIEKAQEELGCTTQEECKTFCQQETNKEICQAFASKYNLKGANANSIVEKAKAELGCQSRETCKAFCELAENKEKCAAFSQKISPNNQYRQELVKEAQTQLGCNSQTECATFCQKTENREACARFGKITKDSVVKKLQEKGTCATNEECRKACEQNPSLCPNFPNNSSNNKFRVNEKRPFEDSSGSRSGNLKQQKPSSSSGTGKKPQVKLPEREDEHEDEIEDRLHQSPPISGTPQVPPLNDDSGDDNDDDNHPSPLVPAL